MASMIVVVVATKSRSGRSTLEKQRSKETKQTNSVRFDDQPALRCPSASGVSVPVSQLHACSLRCCVDVLPHAYATSAASMSCVATGP